MRRRPWPLTALALIGMVALVSACGSSAPAAPARVAAAATTPAPMLRRGEVRRVHAQQRGQQVPGPARVRRIHHRCDNDGSSLDTSTPAFAQALSACRDLEPTGFTGGKRSAQQTDAALKFAQCIRANGVPTSRTPPMVSLSSTRIESPPPQQAVV